MTFRRFMTILFIMSFFTHPARAQQMITVSGFLMDASNGETLGAALVSSAAIASVTNSYGYYSISIPLYSKTLKYSCLGYEPQELSLEANRDTIINVRLSLQSNMISEVVVNINRNPTSERTAKMLNMNAVKQLPSFLGEADLIRSFQLQPGVTTIGDGASGFNVRGGGVDQNLVLLDEAPLYFTSHLFNLFSVANPDAVMDAVLYKSEIPARYGGRLSSVLDTRLRDGNNQHWQATGGIGLIASRLTLEGPLKKDKSAILISARRSYTDVITRQSSNSDLKDNSIYFYDLNTKINFSLGNKDRIFISGYMGRDKIQSAEDFKLQWGTGSGTLRWNHVFSNKLFSNLSLIFSDYRYSLGSMSEPTSSFLWKASIRDYTAKNIYNWYPAPGNTVNFGVESALHIFSPGSALPEGSASIFQPVQMKGQRSADYNVFWNHELRPSERVSIEYGARYTAFQSIATDSTLIYEYVGEPGSRRKPVNAQDYEDGATIKWYHNLQPRLSITWKAGKSATWRASYSHTVQNLHLISNSLSTSPLDMWTPSSYNIKPEQAKQFSLGFSNRPFSAEYKFTAEAYYRQLSNQLDFVDGAETLLNDQLEGDILVGLGRAYGTELQMERSIGKLTGWISYTLSRTERKINGINNNRYYPAKYDKTHALAAVAVYRLKSRILLSATYSAASGTPATLPSSKYEFSGYTVLYNPGNARNNYRIPAYHRLDLSATFKNKSRPGKKISSEWVVSAFNALNRRNAFSMYLRQQKNDPLTLEAVQYSMLGMIVPSVTWNFKF